MDDPSPRLTLLWATGYLTVWGIVERLAILRAARRQNEGLQHRLGEGLAKWLEAERPQVLR